MYYVITARMVHHRLYKTQHSGLNIAAIREEREYGQTAVNSPDLVTSHPFPCNTAFRVSLLLYYDPYILFFVLFHRVAMLPYRIFQSSLNP